MPLKCQKYNFRTIMIEQTEQYEVKPFKISHNLEDMVEISDEGMPNKVSVIDIYGTANIQK